MFVIYKIIKMIEKISFLSAEGRIDDDAASMNDRAESALKLVMARLKDDFRHVLVINAVPLDSTRLRWISNSLLPLSSHRFQTSTVPPLDEVDSEVEKDVRVACLQFTGDLDLDLVHPAAIFELKKIADSMVRSGYEKECCLVYSSVRSHVLDEWLRVLGIEKYSMEEVQNMEWTTLSVQMGKWIQALKLLIKLLTCEKFLCEEVFAGSESMREVCFVESAKGCVMQMLNFSKAVAISKESSANQFIIFDAFDEVAICKGSSEKLFRILDTYDALSDVMPDLEELFNGDSGAGEMVCSEAKGVLEGFRVTAVASFVEFERAVLKESASRMVENGDIHPLTQYVMSYIKLLVDYSEILNGFFEKTNYNSEQLQSDEVDNMERMTFITRRLLSLIKSLESNLEEKSKMYEDGGLQYVFLMNNVLYIVNKLKDPEVRNMLGDQCISKRRDQIRQYAISYLRSSWTKALTCLHFGGLPEKKDLRIRLTNFNAYFEETYGIQTAWKVVDPQLREELRILISENLVQIYRTFVGRFSNLIRIVDIKYTTDDVSSYLLDLFEGTPRMIQSRKHCLCT